EQIKVADLSMRSVDGYNAQLYHAAAKKFMGIRSESVLNKFPDFHVLNNVPRDLMHDSLEGIARIEIRQLVKKLGEQGVSLALINDRIANFGYGRNDKSNKPGAIILTQ
ncbi:hypothetical protein PFISCL1PPCAC_21205, partial [Pristionchus fissidentatus]